jgi:hypothetical protein
MRDRGVIVVTKLEHVVFKPLELVCRKSLDMQTREALECYKLSWWELRRPECQKEGGQ